MVGVIITIAVVFIILAVLSIDIVPQATTHIIERFGTYKATFDTGFHMKVPFIDKVAKRISLKEKVADFAPQAVITKDNVTMQIDTIVFYQVLDPKLYTYGIERPILAIENLSATTLRNIIGEQMREILDDETDRWGIKVNRVELKNIIPPKEIQMAMEKQMKAEREKREAILIAEGKKEAAIREAEGQAEAILKINEAKAQGLQMIKNVQADDGLVKIRSLEAMEKIANGQATKIIIPSELQGVAGLATSVKEIIKS